MNITIELVRDHPSSIEKELILNHETRRIQTVSQMQQSCNLRIPEWYVEDVLISDTYITLIAPVNNGVLAPLEGVYYHHLREGGKRYSNKISPLDLSDEHHDTIAHFQVALLRTQYVGMELFDNLGVTLTMNFESPNS